MVRKLLLTCITALALVFTAACGGGGETAQNEQENADSSPSSTETDDSSVESGAGLAESEAGSAASEAGVADDSEPEAETADEPEADEAETETRDLSDVENRLDELESYRIQFNISFDGTNDSGETESGSIEMMQTYIAESNNQHMRMASEDSTAEDASGTFEFFQIDGTTYTYTAEAEGEAQCFSFSSEEDTLGNDTMLQPDDFTEGVEEANLVGRGEVVNGVDTDHYEFDQADLSFGLFGSAKGEVWVAQDGGYMVRYLGEASGGNGLFGSGDVEGTVTWEYNLEDINAIEAIELPPECVGQGPADDIPVPDNATDQSSFSGFITFMSPDAPTDIATYYRDEMASQGWQSGEETAFGDFITLEFTKEERNLSITISADTENENSVSNVMISEESGT
ncbi:MAG: hypothetical protein AAGF95_15910 [Chloroflexota bacterium]